MQPNWSTAALTADSASAGLVMSNFTTSSSADFPRALATLSVLRPVATTLWPPAKAALAISTPKPRPAPVMSQTLLVAMVLFLLYLRNKDYHSRWMWLMAAGIRTSAMTDWLPNAGT